MPMPTGSARHIPGFNAPAVGFEQPFAMLEACHERVLRTLGLLARLRAHVLQHGADDEARQAARDVLRYFDIAAPLHHQDEELHVFPLLQASASAEVQALVARLQHDHVCMTADWAAARVPLQALVDHGADGDDAPRLFFFSPQDNAALDRFASRYGDHIEAEEGVAYPAAMQLLPPATSAAMGREMAARRGAG
jgi:hemerythrin-like domain-containing protein